MEIIIDKNSAKHYTWGDSCDSWILADMAGLSVKLESMPGNTKEKLHFHKHAQQFFFILKGVAAFYIEEDIIVVTEQQGLLIQANRKHFIANETNAPLDFLVISQPTTNQDRTTIE